jgi:uncharacterized protein involved in tolerance to divalent cations
MRRIKVYTFNFKEYEPNKEGLYEWEGETYTNREFMHTLKTRLIWFNTFFKEVTA